MKKNSLGITLLELLVVAALMGILSTFSYVSYQNYVMRSYKSNAITLLEKCIANIQKSSFDYGSTKGMLDDLGASSSLSHCDLKSDDYYNLSLSSHTGEYVLVWAEPKAHVPLRNHYGLTCNGNKKYRVEDGSSFNVFDGWDDGI